jgi:hypothetical protein
VVVLICVVSVGERRRFGCSERIEGKVLSFGVSCSSSIAMTLEVWCIVLDKVC